MKLTFKSNFFLLTLLIFLTEVAIAVFYKEGFIRHTVGDFLVVILIYYFVKTFVKIDSILLAISTLIFAFAVEFLQLTNFLEILGLKHSKWANLVFGNSFSVQDLVAYTLGVLVVLGLDLLVTAKSRKKELAS